MLTILKIALATTALFAMAWVMVLVREQHVRRFDDMLLALAALCVMVGLITAMAQLLERAPDPGTPQGRPALVR